MPKRYWWILLIYLSIHLSAFVGVPLLLFFNVQVEQLAGTWLIISFSIGLLAILLLLIPDMKERHLTRDRVSRGQAVLWAIAGVFMVFAAQYVAIIIQMYAFGIDTASENTERIIELAKATPLFIIVLAVIGPILEEIVFRLVIFGALYKRFNFWIAAIISALIFAAVHMDFTHILIYTAVGITFAFLYVKTKRIIVPIVAHVAVNSFVTIVQIVFGERLEEIQRQLEQNQIFIGGFFL